MMRITNSMMISQSLRNQNTNMNNMNKWNTDLNAMTNLHKPSDDPVKVGRVLRLQSDISLSVQYSDNLDSAKSWLESTESALSEVSSVMQRIREITVQGANGVLQDDDKQKISQEIGQLRDHLINISNQTYTGRHIFSGYKSNEPFSNSDGSYNTNLGINLSDENIEYKVGTSQNINVNYTGDKVFGITSATEKSMFDMLSDLQTNLDNGDSKAVSDMLGDIDSRTQGILQIRGELGAKINMVDIMQVRIEDTMISTKDLLSKTRDTDMGEAIMQLSTSEAVYKASLAVSARIIQPTLIDFLR